MKRKIKIGIIGIVLLSIIIPVAISTTGKTNVVISPSQAQNIQGSICFKYDNFADTWILSFDHPGPFAYTFSGYDPIYPSSMSGGGGVLNNNLYLTIDERFVPGNFGNHDIVINLLSNPLTGIDYLKWEDINGVVYVNYPNGLTFTQITCPVGVVPKVGPTTAGK